MAIIQPFQKKKVIGPPVARITIEVDSQGQANIDVRNLKMPMTPVPTIWVSKILSAVLDNFITLIMEGKNAGMEPEKPNEITPENPPPSAAG